MRKAVLIGALAVVAAGLGIGGVAYGASDEPAPERTRYVQVVDGLDKGTGHHGGGVGQVTGDTVGETGGDGAGRSGADGPVDGTAGGSDQDCPFDRREPAGTESESASERL